MSDQVEVNLGLKWKVFNIQSQIGKISKDSTNEYFNNAKYYDINALLENLQIYLEANKILLTQPIENGFVITRLECLESGETMESGLELPKLDNPQKTGSCVTYYRRYTCASLFALQTEDDDGNKASGNTPAKNQTKEEDDNKPWLKIGTPQYANSLKALKEGKTIKDIRKFYKVSKTVSKQLEDESNI